jgi:hypothetical protein
MVERPNAHSFASVLYERREIKANYRFLSAFEMTTPFCHREAATAAVAIFLFCHPELVSGSHLFHEIAALH